MKNVYGYIRISDPKQEKGVSREAQKEAIEQYAKNNDLCICRWFQETRSAAKTGRPEYNKMLTELLSANSPATGVIVHKIDRSARNLEDWTHLTKLPELGYGLHFAHEGLDLTKRGDQLSADIQAVMAADYIRNLRQEAIKGLYGRLKQGLYPFKAPIGYHDTGKGNIKEIDPEKAPKIKILFNLYTKDGYSVRRLVQKMDELQLRNIRGNKLSKNTILAILKNPFYTGIMKIKDQTFQGKHQPLISLYQYRRAQDILQNKINTKRRKNHYLFRRKLYCGHCKTTKLIGELQKGRVYYRCQRKDCPTKTVREDIIENHLKELLASVKLGPAEKEAMTQMLQDNQKEKLQDSQKLLQSIQLNLGRLRSQKQKIMDYLIQEIISKEDYQDKVNHLNEQERKLLEQQEELTFKKETYFQKIEKFLELAESLTRLYDLANHDEKRQLLDIVTSNCSVTGRKLYISMASPFYELANRDVLLKGGPYKTTTLKKASTTVCTDKRTSLIYPQPLAKKDYKKFFNLIMEKVSELPDFNFSLINELS